MTFSAQLIQAHTNGTFALFLRGAAADGSLFAALPVFSQLATTPQDAYHHPEGDVLTHTLMVCDCLPTDASLSLALAALFHDIGKVSTTVVQPDGRVTAHGHEDVSADMLADCFALLGLPTDTQLFADVHFLVRRHMCAHSVQTTARTLRRLVRESSVDLVRELLRLGRCDVEGRALVPDFSPCDRLSAMLAELVVPPPRPTTVLNGEEVMALTGLTPGPRLGQVLRALAELGNVDRATAEAFVRDAVRW